MIVMAESCWSSSGWTIRGDENNEVGSVGMQSTKMVKQFVLGIIDNETIWKHINTSSGACCDQFEGSIKPSENGAESDIFADFLMMLA